MEHSKRVMGILTFPTATVYVRGTIGVTRDELSHVMVGFIVVDVVDEYERDVLVVLVGAEEYVVGIILSNVFCVVCVTRTAVLEKMDIKN